MMDTILFPEFAASCGATVGSGEESVPQAESHRVKTDSSPVIPARAGVARSAHIRNEREPEIFATARPLVIKEILALLGDDIPSPTKHTKHLNKLSFEDLCARRDQLLIEKQDSAKAEALRREPELPSRPLRQTRFCYGRKP